MSPFCCIFIVNVAAFYFSLSCAFTCCHVVFKYLCFLIVVFPFSMLLCSLFCCLIFFMATNFLFFLSYFAIQEEIFLYSGTSHHKVTCFPFKATVWENISLLFLAPLVDNTLNLRSDLYMCKNVFFWQRKLVLLLLIFLLLLVKCQRKKVKVSGVKNSLKSRNSPPYFS